MFVQTGNFRIIEGTVITLEPKNKQTNKQPNKNYNSKKIL